MTSFGGPTAHLGYFHEAFVERRQWLSERAYTDPVAFCQFLPGPASSQVSMALGYHRAGWRGMALSWLPFTAPSAVAMAASGMAKSMSNTRALATITVLAAISVLTIKHSITQIAVIVLAGLGGAAVFKDQAAQEPSLDDDSLRRVSARAAIIALSLFVLLFAVLFVGSRTVGGYFLALSAAYYEAGALVSGDGYVVMPLLQNHVVDPGWDSQDQFFSGYSAAQAVPGPLFTFASFLGAVDGDWLGVLWATIMISLPSALLIIAGLRF